MNEKSIREMLKMAELGAEFISNDPAFHDESKASEEVAALCRFALDAVKSLQSIGTFHPDSGIDEKWSRGRAQRTLARHGLSEEEDRWRGTTHYPGCGKSDHPKHAGCDSGAEGGGDE